MQCVYYYYFPCLLLQHICPVTYSLRRDRVAYETCEIFMSLNCENLSEFVRDSVSPWLWSRPPPPVTELPIQFMADSWRSGLCRNQMLQSQKKNIGTCSVSGAIIYVMKLASSLPSGYFLFSPLWVFYLHMTRIHVLREGRVWLMR